MVVIGLDHTDLMIVINLIHEMGFSNLNVFSAVRLMRSLHGMNKNTTQTSQSLAQSFSH